MPTFTSIKPNKSPFLGPNRSVTTSALCGGQSGAGAGFLRALQFPLPIFIPPIAPKSPSSIIWGLYNRPKVAAVPSGLSPTPLMIIIIIIII
jgi:hypothetical protein